jgi:hypothetical protein
MDDPDKETAADEAREMTSKAFRAPFLQSSFVANVLAYVGHELFRYAQGKSSDQGIVCFNAGISAIAALAGTIGHRFVASARAEKRLALILGMTPLIVNVLLMIAALLLAR